ncbi:MAG TPA: TolC family protein [Chitinophagaceae bacterium]
MSKRLKWLLKLTIPVLYLLVAHRSIGQSAPLNLKEAITIALTNNHSVRADSLNISITNEKNKQLAGLYRPQVNYSSGIEYNPAIASQLLPGSIVGQPNKDLVPVQFGTRYSMKSGIEVTQTIYRKDLLIQMRGAGLQTSIAKTKYSLSKEELLYQVATMYYSLQTNAETIRTTHFDYVNMKDVLRIAKAQFENGILKRIDYESLEINVANTLSKLNQLQTQYNDQLAYFNYLLGLPASTETVINDSISQDLYTPESGNPLLQREDIRLSSQMIDAKEIELKSIHAEKKPALSSYFRYNYQSQFNEPGKAFNSDYLYNTATVGIAVTIPIFDGNRRKSRINAARTELEQLKLKSQHQQEQATMELFSANGTLKNNREEYVITKKNLELASNVFNSRKALYTEGVSTLMELLDAERELSQARSQHLQAQINVQTGRLDVYKANGTLLTDFLKSL